jgi:hypothetical protein
MTLKTPGGSPLSLNISPNYVVHTIKQRKFKYLHILTSRTVTGANSEGLHTIVFPVASAGAIFFIAISIG